MSLTRKKVHKISSNYCADCSSPDPSWASINHGVLICSECCSVHRTLGRHISQVRSLSKGRWEPNQLAMVYTLASRGANSIWEHGLLDPLQPVHNTKAKKKPNASDPVYPFKADFIRAKYQNLSYMLRPSGESLKELNTQLHNCVRTTNIETTLRLLAVGANPNYFDVERGTTPLHIAAKEGQSLQIELLAVYGADPAMPDFDGRSPGEYAKMEGFPDLFDRLEELRYELTDTLSYVLCGKKPNHKSGQHFLIPEVAVDYGETFDSIKHATTKLQALKPKVFEKLLTDVFDETDRREVDSQWVQSAQTSHKTSNAASLNDRYVVPFLPVNPGFSTTRNQARQKLAKFNARDFTTVQIDILSETKRRHFGYAVGYHTSVVSIPTGSTKSSTHLRTGSEDRHQHHESKHRRPSKSDSSAASDSAATVSKFRNDSGKQSVGGGTLSSRRSKHRSPDLLRADSESVPDYDQVPSDSGSNDEDALLESLGDHLEVSEATVAEQRPARQGQATLSNDFESLVTVEDYIEVKQQLAKSEAHTQQLGKTLHVTQLGLLELQKKVSFLVSENALIKSSMSKVMGAGGRSDRPFEMSTLSATATSSSQQQPKSASDGDLMLNQSKQDQHENAVLSQLREKSTASNSSPPSVHIGVTSSFPTGQPSQHNGPPMPPKRHHLIVNGGEQMAVGNPRNSSYLNVGSGVINNSDYMDAEALIIHKTEDLARVIKVLYNAAQTGDHDSFPASAYAIRSIVDSMVPAVSQLKSYNVMHPERSSPRNIDQIDASLSGMVEASMRLIVSSGRQVTGEDHAQHGIHVAQVAFDVAKNAKLLINCVQNPL